MGAVRCRHADKSYRPFFYYILYSVVNALFVFCYIDPHCSRQAAISNWEVFNLAECMLLLTQFYYWHRFKTYRFFFPSLLGIEALKRKAGIIVAQGELREFPNFPLEKFTVKFITMKSARGHSYRACELALEQIASKRFPLELITTHKFGLKDVDLAIRSVGNEGVPDVIHASLMPWE